MFARMEIPENLRSKTRIRDVGSQRFRSLILFVGSVVPGLFMVMATGYRKAVQNLGS